MTTNEILVGIDFHVATITLNRPNKLNAVTPAHFAELVDLLSELSANAAVRVVVMTGAGRAFCAGGDVSILSQGGPAAGKPFEQAVPIIRDGSQVVVEAIRNTRPVVIAAVNGVCAGGGLSLACAADLRYASDTAMFATAFGRVAQPGDMGLAWTLTNIVGTSRARELMFRSNPFDAQMAREVGLVNDTVPHDSLQSFVAGRAAEIAEFAPLAIAAMKHNLNDAQRLGFGEYLDLETERYVRNSSAADTTEGAKAFLEKRPAVYAGR